MKDQRNFSSARFLLRNRSTQSVQGLLHADDRTDWYQFRLRSSSQLDLRLTGFQGNGNVTLFDRSGQVIERLSLRFNGERSRRSSQPQAEISETLEAGSFFVRVAASRGSQTAYRLKLSAAQVPAQGQPAQPDPSLSGGSIVAPAQPAPPNREAILAPTQPAPLPTEESIAPPAQPPVLAPTVSLNRNEGLNTIRGNRLRITDSLLQATSSQQSDANQLVYTLTRLPQNAVLELNGRSLSLGDRFTQQDIFNGALEYRSTAPNLSLREIFRSSTAHFIYPLGISDDLVMFAALEYDPVRNVTDTDLFLNNGFATIKVGDSVVSEAGKVLGVDYSIEVQDFGFSWALFAVYQRGILPDQFLYSAGTLTKLASDILYLRGGTARFIGSDAIWVEPRSLWENSRPTPDDRIYKAGLSGGTSTRLAQESEFDQFVGFTDWGWVWTGTDGADDGSDREIFLFDSRTNQTRQLTQNEVNERSVRVSGSLVTWETDEPDNPLFFYDGSTTRTISTTPGNQNTIVGVFENQIVWSSQARSQFFTVDYSVYDLTTGRSTLIADNFPGASQMRGAGSHIFWQENRPNSEIFLYDSKTQQTCQVTDETTTNDRLLSVQREGAFIGSGEEGKQQLYFFDSQTAKRTQLSESGTVTSLINTGSNFTPTPARSGGARAATWSSQNPESHSPFQGKTMLYRSSTRSAVQLTSEIFSITHIAGDRVAFNTTELTASPQAGAPPIQEQVLYLYRVPEICRCGGLMEDSFGFSLTDGMGGAIEGSFSLKTD